MVFIDLKKAYDSVQREVLWECLKCRERISEPLGICTRE